MLRHIESGVIWNGEAINGIRHPRDIETKWSAEELAFIGLEVYNNVLPPTSSPEFSDLVNAERDRRINAGFTFNSVDFDSDPDSRNNITGALSFAQLAISQGAEMGDLRWANPDIDFSWIASDNSLVTMDAHTCVEFCIAAMRYKSALYIAARTIKDLTPQPENYTDDSFWPSRNL